jgi:hypothetical protein
METYKNGFRNLFVGQSRRGHEALISYRPGGHGTLRLALKRGSDSGDPKYHEIREVQKPDVHVDFLDQREHEVKNR